MPKQYYVENFATVEHDEEVGVVVAQMTEYPGQEQFREYMCSIIDAVIDTGCPNILADTRKQPALSNEDIAWSAETWGPKAESAGVERIAALTAPHIAAKITIDTVTEQSTHDDIERNYFEKFYEAIEWLEDEPT